MGVKEDLFTKLSTDPGVIALVGTRVFPHISPNSATFPYITNHRNSAPGHHNMAGVSDINNPNFQVDCWGLTSVSATAVAKAVVDALDGFVGVVGGTDFRGIFKDNEIDFREPKKDGNDEVFYRIMVEFEIWFK